jgi:hypothetical protein
MDTRTKKAFYYTIMWFLCAHSFMGLILKPEADLFIPAPAYRYSVMVVSIIVSLYIIYDLITGKENDIHKQKNIIKKVFLYIACSTVFFLIACAFHVCAFYAAGEIITQSMAKSTIQTYRVIKDDDTTVSQGRYAPLYEYRYCLQSDAFEDALFIFNKFCVPKGAYDTMPEDYNDKKFIVEKSLLGTVVKTYISDGPPVINEKNNDLK